ncbi:MAG: hypothetical protein IAF58_21735 [Leptolyngbya sp.]|nr:hypothetical protein [Candidatus Melainabacteria bacterium]
MNKDKLFELNFIAAVRIVVSCSRISLHPASCVVTVTVSNISPKDIPLSPWGCVRSMTKLAWWHASVKAAFAFAPHCFKSAIYWTLAGVTVYVSSELGTIKVTSQALQLNDLLVAGAALLFGLVFGMTFLLLGFGGWLMCLSAYSKVLVDATSVFEIANLSKEKAHEIFKNAFLFVDNKRVHIGLVLLYSSLYMIFPFIVIIAIGAFKAASMPEIFQQSALKVGAWPDIVSTVVGIPVVTAMTIYSFTSLIVAASANLTPRAAANLALSLSWKLFFPLALVTFVFVFLNACAGAPSDLKQMISVDTLIQKQNMTVKSLSHLWQGLISIILFPLTLTPVCEILRPSLRAFEIPATDSPAAEASTPGE